MILPRLASARPFVSPSAFGAGDYGPAPVRTGGVSHDDGGEVEQNIAGKFLPKSRKVNEVGGVEKEGEEGEERCIQYVGGPSFLWEKR